ncbi:hypothetical protein BH09VER1_BH09VER1_02160 [soil metagenome]
MLIRILAIALCLTGIGQAAVITDFSDIQYWVGSGTNEAAMVIDWQDGKTPVSLAWGFRWDGVATGWDMMQAIAAADPRLSIETLTYFGSTFLFGVFYDVSGTGDSYTPGVPGEPNFPVADVEDTPGDAGPVNHYQSGIASGYWEYYASGGDFSYAGGANDFAGSSSYPGTNGTPDWRSSFVGADGRTLSDGSWDTWSFAPGFASQIIDTPIAAVPEPRTIGLIFLSAGLLVWRFRRIHVANGSK